MINNREYKLIILSCVVVSRNDVFIAEYKIYHAHSENENENNSIPFIVYLLKIKNVIIDYLFDEKSLEDSNYIYFIMILLIHVHFEIVQYIVGKKQKKISVIKWGIIYMLLVIFDVIDVIFIYLLLERTIKY